MIDISPSKDTKVFLLDYFHRMNRLDIKRGFRKWSSFFRDSAEHPLARKLERKYPELFRHFMLRFDPHHFRGLPLSMLLLGIFLNMFILSELAEEVREISKLRSVDRRLAAFFFSIRDEKIAVPVYHFTRLGSSPTVLAVWGVITLVLLRKKASNSWLAIVASLAVSSLTAYAGKIYYRFPRPVDTAWYEEFSYSFPSGHATVAMAYYGLLFYLLFLHVKTSKLKALVFISAVLFITAMGFSRVYLGVHYLSDVLSGLSIGFVWLLFSVTLLGWLDFRKDLQGLKGE